MQFDLLAFSLTWFQSIIDYTSNWSVEPVALLGTVDIFTFRSNVAQCFWHVVLASQGWELTIHTTAIVGMEVSDR